MRLLPVMLATSKAGDDRKSKRRTVRSRRIRSRWIPSAARSSRRRSSFAMRREPRQTGLFEHHLSWLDGSCLPSAFSGVLTGLFSTARSRPGGATKEPCANCTRSSGENGPARTSHRPPTSDRLAVVFGRGPKGFWCLGRGHVGTNRFLGAQEHSPSQTPQSGGIGERCHSHVTGRH